MPASRQRSRSPSIAFAVIATIHGRRSTGTCVDDPARRLEPVELGHLHVHQHEVVRLALDRLDRLDAVARRRRPRSPSAPAAAARASGSRRCPRRAGSAAGAGAPARGRGRATPGRGAARAAARRSAAARVAIVTWKVLPSPGTPALSAHIVPPIASASRFEIASPSPVPPYRRLIDASAWLNDWNSRPIAVGRDADAGVAHGEVQLERRRRPAARCSTRERRPRPAR